MLLKNLPLPEKFGSQNLTQHLKFLNILSLSCFVVSDSLRPQGPTRLLSPWDYSRQEHWSGLPFPSPGESPRPRDQTWVSRVVGRRFLPSELPRKPVPSLGKNKEKSGAEGEKGRKRGGAGEGAGRRRKTWKKWAGGGEGGESERGSFYLMYFDYSSYF